MALDIIGMDVHSYDDVHTVFCNIEIALSIAYGDVAACQADFQTNSEQCPKRTNRKNGSPPSS